VWEVVRYLNGDKVRAEWVHYGFSLELLGCSERGYHDSFYGVS
jgi:hypothetical protein